MWILYRARWPLTSIITVQNLAFATTSTINIYYASFKLYVDRLRNVSVNPFLDCGTLQVCFVYDTQVHDFNDKLRSNNFKLHWRVCMMIVFLKSSLYDG